MPLRTVGAVQQDNLDDDKDVFCDIVSNSWDPNDKQVSPSGVDVAHYIEAMDKLDYKIRFQNTGNDTAFLVRVIDSIDTDKMDITSFQQDLGLSDRWVTHFLTHLFG